MKRKSNIVNAAEMMFLWFVKLTAAPFLYLYFKLKLIGRDKREIDGPTILVANHISLWDPVLVNFVFPTKRIYFMTASEMFGYNRLFTWFLNTLGAFSVNRRQPDLNSLSMAIDVLRNDKIMGIFPEGLRSLNHELLPFKPGAVIAALDTGAPIIPIYIHGKYGLFRRITVIVGEKIQIREHCQSEHVSQSELKQLCELLRSKVDMLSEQIP